MFEPNIDFNSELLFMPYGGSPRARIPLVAPKTPQEETRDTVGVAPNVELRKQPAVTPVTPITPATTQTSVTPEFKSVAPKPTPVTPPNRVGQPVSAGEFIPEPTTVPPKPAPTSVAPAPTSVAPAPTSVAPTEESIQTRGENKPIAAKDAFKSYKDTLLGAASKNVYDIVDDVDEVDDYYDRVFRNTVIDPLNPKKALDRETAMEIRGGGGRDSYYSAPKAELSFTPDEYLSEVGGSEYLKGLKSGVGVDNDAVRSAYSTIANTSGADTAVALSSYYGFDVVPTTGTPSIRDFGGNYETHTNASQEQISEFQSLVKPILAEIIPYIQATEGVGYQEALLEAYKRDPMLQAMYAKYGVQPIRQTKDGSTYLYDPMTFGEIRTKEVKDSSIKDAVKIAAIVGLSVFGGGALAGTAAFGGGTSAVGTALAYGTTSAGITAITGGDTNDILKSFALAGIGGYAKGLDAVARNAALAAEGAKAGSELAVAAKAAADTADTFNRVVAGAKFVDAAIDGNLAGAVLAVKGPDITKAALNKVGFTEDFLDGYNINRNDLEAGLNKTQMELAKGADFGDAIAEGFKEYIKEGGALGPNNVKTPEFIKKIGDAIAEAGRNIDDLVLQPVKGAVEPVIDVARDVGRSIDDEVLQPAKEVVQGVTEPITKPIVETTKEVGRTVDDAVLQPVKKIAEGVYANIPQVGVNLPSVGLGAPSLGAPFGSPRSPRYVRDTGYTIFDKGEREAEADIIAKYLVGLDRSFAGGGAAKGSYGSVDELLRIVGGK